MASARAPSIGHIRASPVSTTRKTTMIMMTQDGPLLVAPPAGMRLRWPACWPMRPAWPRGPVESFVAGPAVKVARFPRFRARPGEPTVGCMPEFPAVTCAPRDAQHRRAATAAHGAAMTVPPARTKPLA